MSEPPLRPTIDVAFVHRLVAAQFPSWSHLPIAPVEYDGWDNRTFRLGADMSVRLPSAAGYVPQVAKEQRWLPRLAPSLPLPIPAPLAAGRPGEGYPWPWSSRRWLAGDIAQVARSDDRGRFARDVAAFRVALQGSDTTGGPPAGAHSFYRGAPPAVYDGETQQALAALDGHIDTGTAAEVWRAALAATWTGRPVWVHGDALPAARD